MEKNIFHQLSINELTKIVLSSNSPEMIIMIIPKV